MMKISDKIKRNLIIVQGCTIFFFLGFLALFYMLGGATDVSHTQKIVRRSFDTLPNAMVEEMPDDRLEAFVQATSLLQKEKELEDVNNSFQFLEDAKESSWIDEKDTSLDEGVLDKLKEVVIGTEENPILPNRKQVASRARRKTSRTTDNLHSLDDESDDLRSKMQAEIADREKRLQELYYGKASSQSADKQISKEDDDSVKIETKRNVLKNKNGFRTLGASSGSTLQKGSIRAVIHGEQKNITESSQIKIRLLDPIVIDNFTIPRNTIIFGMASFFENRVNIDIENIAFHNNIYPFRGRIYDQDGFLGIYIPDNLVNEAKTEASSETVSSTDINFGGLTSIVSSGANAIVNATKNVVSGSIRRTKVTLPANYKLIIKTDEKD